MILYSFFMSSCAWRVRAVLAAKGIEYEYRPVNIRKQEQHGESYLRVNALGQVPALVDGDLTLTQSMAILEYLEETHPEVALLPAEPTQRALVRQICEIINAGTQPPQSVPYKKMDELGGDGAGLAWGQEVIKKGFAVLEALLAKTAGTCCVGDQLSLADCCLVPQVFNSKVRFNVDIEVFPTISRLQKALLKRKEFLESHPTKMPDYSAGLIPGLS